MRGFSKFDTGANALHTPTITRLAGGRKDAPGEDGAESRSDDSLERCGPTPTPRKSRSRRALASLRRRLNTPSPPTAFVPVSARVTPPSPGNDREMSPVPPSRLHYAAYAPPTPHSPPDANYTMTPPTKAEIRDAISTRTPPPPSPEVLAERRRRRLSFGDTEARGGPTPRAALALLLVVAAACFVSPPAAAAPRIGRVEVPRPPTVPPRPARLAAPVPRAHTRLLDAPKPRRLGALIPKAVDALLAAMLAPMRALVAVARRALAVASSHLRKARAIRAAKRARAY